MSGSLKQNSTHYHLHSHVYKSQVVGIVYLKASFKPALMHKDTHTQMRSFMLCGVELHTHASRNANRPACTYTVTYGRVRHSWVVALLTTSTREGRTGFLSVILSSWRQQDPVKQISGSFYVQEGDHRGSLNWHHFFTSKMFSEVFCQLLSFSSVLPRKAVTLKLQHPVLLIRQHFVSVKERLLNRATSVYGHR